MPKTRTILLALVFTLLGHLLGLATAWGIISWSHGEWPGFCFNPGARQMPLFWEVWDIVQADFIGQLPDERTMTYGAIRGALGTLNDPYAALIEPQLHQREKEDLEGKFGGIGVKMQRDETGHVILSPMPDTPALRAGIQEGDILIAVDGKPITSTTSFEDIKALVRGPVGTPVTLGIQRGDPPLELEFTIVRAEIALPSVDWRLVEGMPEIGYIALSRFSERTRDELVRAIEDLRAQGATGLILDLRDNGGGLRHAGIQVASQFLSDGVVMYQKQREDEPEETFAVMSGGVATDLPLVVLVNKGTASAAEIVAGALQDHGRAKLVGEQTFGKGSVQHIYDLSDGSSLHVTAAEWLTPRRHQLTGQGLTPDVIVARTQEDVNAGRDPQLEAAARLLQKAHGNK